YLFLVQHDCNSVFYYKYIVLWNTNTYGESFDCKFRLQEDGNFVLYSAFDLKPLYATGTYCNKLNCVKPSIFILQLDCNLVLYQDDKPLIQIWSSKTKCYN
ncbi:hypothetical protein SELMODRAFT_19144, partial [Selaginella moellendorffii]